MGRSVAILGVVFVFVFAFLMGGAAPLAEESKAKPADVEKQTIKVATFAGGCFWCMEPPFEKLPGVSKVISGYAGGSEISPKYKDVASGKTSHREAVQVHYDPSLVSYKDLLEVFWRSVNPTDVGGQFVDRGFQYSSAIFFHSESQKSEATKSKEALIKSKRFRKSIVTPVIEATSFYPAEDYHQDYYKKSPIRYKFYRFNSGRDQFIDRVWGDARTYIVKSPNKKSYSKPSEEVLRKKLTKLQYYVTQKDGTEAPFKNQYWNSKEVGIYVDIASGEPLFSSTDKYKSGTGWPSFTKPIDKQYIVEKVDYKLLMKRVEVRSKHGDSHLGHVFTDGPEPTGLRYCINSAALKFVPLNQMKQQGYGEYLRLFERKQSMGQIGKSME